VALDLEEDVIPETVGQPEVQLTDLPKNAPTQSMAADAL
jgi:hypothetical protein